RNKADLEEQSLDDLLNNLKIYEAKVRGSSPTTQNTQNIAFVSSHNTNNINESVTAASISAASSKARVSTRLNVDSLTDVVIYSFFASQSNNPQLDNKDLKQIDPDDLEKMDLKWEVQSARDNRNKEPTRRTVLVEVSTSNDLVLSVMQFMAMIRVFKLMKNLLIIHLWHTPHQAHQVLQDQIISHESDNTVPKNPKNDSESVATVLNVESSTNKPSKDMSKTLRPGAPIIEDWISDSKDKTKNEFVPKQREPIFVKSFEHVKILGNLPIPTAVTQSTVKNTWPVKHVVNKAHSPGNPQQAIKDTSVIDSGCSRHMTGNISFLSDFEEIDGGLIDGFQRTDKNNNTI
nr:hypothetical protein [Tanacetum cinerariifolium]